MSQVRLAALATLLAAAGCYTDAPPQSTMPEPQYVSGPPGGGMDPGYSDSPHAPAGAPGASGAVAVSGSAGAAEDPDDADSAEPMQPPPPGQPGQPGQFDGALPPGGPRAPGGPGDVAQIGGPAVAPGVAGDPTATVSDDEIDTTLDGYGQWIDTDDYGQVWRPDATVVGVDFTPYESGGSWAYTDAGWAFACDYPWGWLPFHYGRWAWFHGYWGWVPGHRWGPAWVQWRHGGGVVGWRPLLPDHRGPGHRWHGGDAPFRDHRHAEQHDAHWRFAATSDLGRPHIRAHLYGNTAEGLRVTSAVAAPPVRGATTVRAADLMRNRFAAGARLAQPGPGRSVGPARTYQPPARTYQPPGRTYQPPTRTYQPPAQAYRPPVYQPPTRSYQPPARTYQPPAQSYRPPVYQPPARGYQPPGRTYQPPVRTYRPPVRTYQPSSPPSHAWAPPSHTGGSSSSSSSHASSSSSGSSHASSSSTSSHSSSGGGHHR